MKYGFVYIWRDRKHKRYYIGSHWGTEDDGYICSSRWMRKAYRRRPQDFKRRIISRVIKGKGDLLQEEYKWLQLISDNEIGKKYYNLTRHLNGHWVTDEEKRLTICEKISKANKGKPSPNKGKTLSEETKKKVSIGTKRGMSNIDKSYYKDENFRKKRSESAKRLQKECKIGMLGKTHSEKTKEKMSASQSGSNNPMYNKTHDEETKRKISEASKLMWAKRRMEKA
jgi:hypothetical protein